MKVLPSQTYIKGNQVKDSAEAIRNKLKLKALETKLAFSQKYPEAQKFFEEKGIDLGKIREHSAKILGAGALTGTLLFTTPSSVGNISQPTEIIRSWDELINEGMEVPKKFLVETLQKMLPEKTRPLSRQEEKSLEVLFSNILKIPNKATLEGEHLNQTYGLIGAEQHLKRYPGDSINNHGPYFKEGIAPGLGAWGYFARSKEMLTPDLVEKEKWYAVVQTLYLPDWSKRQPYLRDWYKHRKVLIVNTKNGNAVVAAIADSGPAAWTGKHFGGSPEVMEYLGGARYKKGPVVIFFVDDPQNVIPLGPVDYNELALPEGVLTKA